MKFEIDFNYVTQGGNKVLEMLGAKLEQIDDDCSAYTIELDGWDDLALLQTKINDEFKNENEFYSMVVNLDGYPFIYFDNKV